MARTRLTKIEAERLTTILNNIEDRAWREAQSVGDIPYGAIRRLAIEGLEIIEPAQGGS